MRSGFSNPVTSSLSESTRGFVVKLKLAIPRLFRRARPWAEAKPRYRDSPVIEVRIQRPDFGREFSVSAGDYVLLASASHGNRLRLFAKLFGSESLGRGELCLSGTDLSQLPRAKRRELVARRVGFVCPELQLAPDLTVRENLRVPLLLGGLRGPAADARVSRMLGELGISGIADERPAALSDCEQQHVELVRAVTGDIDLLVLEDFPRGLSSRERASLVAAAWRLARSHGLAVLHDSDCLEAIPYSDAVHEGSPVRNSVFDE